MSSHLLGNISQYGPPDSVGLFQRYYWIPLLILVPLAMIVLYRLLFPNLQKIKVEKTTETKVEEKKSLTENTISMNDEGTLKPLEPISKTATPEKSSTEIALQLMDTDERRIIQTLLDANGSILQKEISWKTGFSRVKTHRVLARLIRRGVVTAEKYYNTNKIILSSSIFDKKDKA